MNAPAEHPKVRAHRLERAEALTRFFDKLAEARGIDPLDQAQLVLDQILSKLDASGWAEAGELAGLQSKPGPGTIALVLFGYRERARISAQRPRFRVRWYAPKRGIQISEFRSRAEAESFAEGQRIYARRARVEEVT